VTIKQSTEGAKRKSAGKIGSTITLKDLKKERNVINRGQTERKTASWSGERVNRNAEESTKKGARAVVTAQERVELEGRKCNQLSQLADVKEKLDSVAGSRMTEKGTRRGGITRMAS